MQFRSERSQPNLESQVKNEEAEGSVNLDDLVLLRNEDCDHKEHDFPKNIAELPVISSLPQTLIKDKELLSEP